VHVNTSSLGRCTLETSGGHPGGCNVRLYKIVDEALGFHEPDGEHKSDTTLIAVISLGLHMVRVYSKSRRAIRATQGRTYQDRGTSSS